MSKTVKIDPETHADLVRLSEAHGLNMGILIGYALEIIEKYNLMDPNWLDQIMEERFHQLLIGADIEYKKKFEENKYKSILKIQEAMIKKKLDLMPRDQAVEFIDQMIGKPDNALDLIDRITATQVYKINGESKMMQPDADGKPRIQGVPPSQIVKCREGFHTAMSDCRACYNRLTCDTRRGFIIDWLAVHGTNRQREEFIETGRFKPPKLEEK